MHKKYSSIKPIYRYELEQDYQRHKSKLKEIRLKTHSPTNQSIAVSSRIQEYMRNDKQRHSRVIQDQNEKLLSRLLKISTRNSAQPGESQKQRVNLHRKKWLESIRRENEDLGDRLTNLRSSLEYKNFSKSIEDYQKVKRSMMLNRKARLPNLSHDSMALLNSRNIAKTEPTENSEHSLRRIKKITLSRIDSLEKVELSIAKTPA